MTLTNQNYIHEESRSMLDSKYACYHGTHSLLSRILKGRN